MNPKKLYDELISQLSPHNRGFAPDYERFSRQSMVVQKVLPSRIINTTLSVEDCYPKSNKFAYNSILPLNEATKYLEQLEEKSKDIILSFELPTSDAVVMDIYKQFTCKDEYRNVFLELSRDYGVYAHITLGLIEDAMVDEMETIDFLAANQPKGIIFSVFIPEKVTPESKCQIMPIERAAAVFMYAHKKLPECPMTLSCVHPGGDYGKELEILAFMHGVKRIENSI